MSGNAFSAGMEAIFADANMAQDAFYLGSTAWPGARCRVIRRAPTETYDGVGQMRLATGRIQADLLASSIPERPVRGATLNFDGADYKIEEVTADSMNLRWHLVLSRQKDA